ncbi:phenylalanine ammonia-lyase [Hygrophoropsis aurantiaca]|uniref:Phenylalanine ammonia-lyase n=1 Tax=Hygrophoropsis aurantiaca TaxID=72124 RepID=A0ACB8ADV5_9AGAM|nr:phenylalanine ammonia-lyase [Hygrophoropsis aurantiaca]
MSTTTLLTSFVADTHELDSYLSSSSSSKPITVDGQSLSLPAVVAVARYGVTPDLSRAPHIAAKMAASRSVIEGKMAAGLSVYGVSTGFGGSANTRTDDAIALGAALLQHQHSGVLITDDKHDDEQKGDRPLPLSMGHGASGMPEAWVRAALVIRTNSLVRGHSGVRPVLVERMLQLLGADIVPLVPLRGSISASGDLSSLSYIAGTLIGNPAIRVWANDADDASSRARRIVPSNVALARAGIAPLPLASKEHLGILNGTAFSAALSALVLSDATTIAVLAAFLTALSTEALKGTRGNFHPFIGEARPHPGQVSAAALMDRLLEGSRLASDEHGRDEAGEAGEEYSEAKIEDDVGVLRQDRYSLRTAPQWLGPIWEDLDRAKQVVHTELNSTTDNPLVQPPGPHGHGAVHHGGNFQALALTNVMDHTRLDLALIGKLLFSQVTEMINPATSRGLPPDLAASDPSINYAAKGIDIASASYVSELISLGAINIGVAGVSAEMHNQSINSLALISARHTLTALDVVSLLAASHLYAACQALDLRALQEEFEAGVREIVKAIVGRGKVGVFGILGRENVCPSMKVNALDADTLTALLLPSLLTSLEKTGSMDAHARMVKVAEACVPLLVELFAGSEEALFWFEACVNGNGVHGINGINGMNCHAHSATASTATHLLPLIPEFRRRLAAEMEELLISLRGAYLGVERNEMRVSNGVGAASIASLSAGLALNGDAKMNGGPKMNGHAAAKYCATVTVDTSFRGRAPAAHLLGGGTRALYEFVRGGVGIEMHGAGNLRGDVFGMGGDADGMTGFEGQHGTIGDDIGRIYEAIRDGRVRRVLARVVGGGL